MTSKSLFKSMPFLYQDIPKRMQRRQERIASSLYKPRFEDLVSKFESKIEFGVESDNKSGVVETLIGPLPKPTGVPNAAGKSVLGSDVYKWLDDGIRAGGPSLIFPSNWANVTSPNSLATTSRDFNRAQIVLNREAQDKFPGTSPRNFSELVEQELRPTYIQRMEAELRKAVRQSGRV